MVDGVTVVGDPDTSVAVVTDLTPELKAYIRDHLSRVCYGASFTESAVPGYYSLRRTVDEFLKRYDTKAYATQLGMIGELLTHLLAPKVYDDLDTVGLFFNKEERSIKKGFDLTFYGRAEEGVWYGEVKSGEISSGEPVQKVLQLLKTAALDLEEKLSSEDRRSLWDAAQLDAAAVLGENATSVRQILQKDEIAASEGDAWRRLGILVAALFHPVNAATLRHDELLEKLAAATVGQNLDGVRILAIQKSTIQKVVDFLRMESSDA